MRGTLRYGSKNVTNPINSKFSDPWNDASFGSLHPTGCMFTRADGSVPFLRQSIDMLAYRALASRVLEMQVGYDGSHGMKLKQLEPSFTAELRDADAWYANLCDGLQRTPEWTVYWRGLAPDRVAEAVAFAQSQPIDIPSPGD